MLCVMTASISAFDLKHNHAMRIPWSMTCTPPSMTVAHAFEAFWCIGAAEAPAGAALYGHWQPPQAALNPRMDLQAIFQVFFQCVCIQAGVSNWSQIAGSFVVSFGIQLCSSVLTGRQECWGLVNGL